jgi:diketogulonate reductase-like aldo/keto reductase
MVITAQPATVRPVNIAVGAVLFATLAISAVSYETGWHFKPKRGFFDATSVEPETLVTLNNGVKMPWLSYGTWLVDKKQIAVSVPMALNAGFVHIDEAFNYGNQEAVGAALADFPRESFFLTTKIEPYDWMTSEEGKRNAKTVAKAILNRCRQQLRVETLDLALIHWPANKCEVTRQLWRGLEEFMREGHVRAIGVSNFGEDALDCLMSDTLVLTPAINQIKYHLGDGTAPYGKAGSDKYGVLLQAHSPLGFARPGSPQWDPADKALTNGDLVSNIGKKYGKTGAQVSIKWLLQRGVAVSASSNNEEHIKADLDVFDFTLSAEDMATLDAATMANL